VLRSRRTIASLARTLAVSSPGDQGDNVRTVDGGHRAHTSGHRPLCLLLRAIGHMRAPHSSPLHSDECRLKVRSTHARHPHIARTQPPVAHSLTTAQANHIILYTTQSFATQLTRGCCAPPHPPIPQLISARPSLIFSRPRATVGKPIPAAALDGTSSGRVRRKKNGKMDPPEGVAVTVDVGPIARELLAAHTHLISRRHRYGTPNL
jgi:hypothetical protein